MGLLLALVLLSPVVLWLGITGWTTWRYTHRAPPSPSPETPVVEGATVEDLRIVTDDGVELAAWYLQPPPGRPVFVLLHGIHGTRDWERNAFSYLREREMGGLALSFRGHGDSGGEHRSFGWDEARDVVAAVAFLEDRAPTSPVFVRGVSLGAVAAIFAGDDLDERVDGYFLEMPFRDLETVSRNWIRHRGYSERMADLYQAGVRFWGRFFLPVSADAISPIREIEGLSPSATVSIIVGIDDHLVGLSDAEDLHAACPADCELVILAGVGHESLPAAAPERWGRALAGFLERAGVASTE